ncbi:hypothetical protein ACJIZ3_008313 [Penstemon smallii]|uniref:Uncharacterized protein n=1 Tax=Penstemon smallii TaxID=265156 RepID=A0ABD3T9T8_9LAMI
MCSSATEWIDHVHYSFQQKPKRTRVRVLKLLRRKRREEEMEVRNLKMYMENISILEENEKLRKQATLLHQENLALMSEFQKRFSNSDINN